MGYTTDFNGELTMSKPLSNDQFEYINKLAETRRVKRNVKVLMKMYGGKDGYPGRTPDKNTPEEIYGIEGEFFVGGTGYGGQDNDASVIDSNQPPGQKPYAVGFKGVKKHPNKGKKQPSLWCQWIVEGEGDGMTLLWDGGEKFYNYIEWLEYLIDRFFNPWGVILNGEIEWVGEDSGDRGKIVVKDNVVEVFTGKTVYEKQ